MRHGKKFNHLGRKKGHREAMLHNMASSLIMHKRIFTTTAKAKALRQFVEPILTKSKENTTHSRRVVFGYLQDKEAVQELFSTVAPKINDRPGGYTRILKTHNRLGDNAEMCMMELVDFNEMMLEAKASGSAAKSGAKRTRRGGKKTAEAGEVKAPQAPKVAVESKTEDVVEEKTEDQVEEVVAETQEAIEEVKAEAVETPETETSDETPEASSESSEENTDDEEKKAE